ncbi:hypothetical protein ZEAMMB73_Zm00001d026519 [Zea mays]|nr:hypothetical protein ZEAMMB73_Zm00001d026519 [Zea mays]
MKQNIYRYVLPVWFEPTGPGPLAVVTRSAVVVTTYEPRPAGRSIRPHTPSRRRRPSRLRPPAGRSSPSRSGNPRRWLLRRLQGTSTTGTVRWDMPNGAEASVCALSGRWMDSFRIDMTDVCRSTNTSNNYDEDGRAPQREALNRAMSCSCWS